MKRREFVAASCLAGLAPLAGAAGAEVAPGRPDKEYLELRRYLLESAQKQKALVDFFGEAAVPALNRIGITPVGVFTVLPQEKSSITEPTPNLYVVLPHKSIESVVTASARLLADDEYLKAGKAVLDAPRSDPAYTRVESSLMIAFDETPKLEVPVKKDSRLFQLRTYESHSAKAGERKVEMFNRGGEIAIFRRTGLLPVFFGQTLIGDKLPNLTYMVGFEDMEANEAAWAAFRADPGWLKLRADPYYKDTVSGITNIYLRPAPCSQV